jgi:hypothetical protein
MRIELLRKYQVPSRLAEAIEKNAPEGFLQKNLHSIHKAVPVPRSIPGYVR